MTGKVLVGALCAVLIGIATQGCGSKSGRQVPAGSLNANLTVINQGASTVEVFVDYARIGTVLPGTQGFFQVVNGLRPVHIRERGDPYDHYLGDFTFRGDTIIDITYDPGFTRNCVVTNLSPARLFFYVGGVEIALVRPNERRDLFVNPGRYDVHVREEGQLGLTFVGTFDFAPAGSVLPEVTVLYQ